MRCLLTIAVSADLADVDLDNLDWDNLDKYDITLIKPEGEF